MTPTSGRGCANEERTGDGQPFRLVVADPPWLFGDSLPGETRGASKQYGCMTQADLLAFALPPIADDAMLLLWRVASMQQEALDVAKAWGFTVKSEIVWEKLTKLGKPWFGMGRYTRASHETCLVCTRGRFAVADRSIRSRFAAPVPVGADGKYIHSAKPDEIFQIAEKLASHGPYLEVFARKRRPGWEAIGDELPDDLPSPSVAPTQAAQTAAGTGSQDGGR